MKKKVQVVMLPTEKASRLYKAPWDEPPTIGYFNNPEETIKGDSVAHHLYLVSDDEIKEGDWYYNERDKAIRKGNTINHPYHKKVIATTDKSLIDGVRWSKEFPLPQIPESFIKAYVEANGEIDEVYVEMQYNAGYNIPLVGRPSEPITLGGVTVTPEMWDEYKEKRFTLALRSDNTVRIHPVEQKMYSRDKVERLIWKAVVESGGRKQDLVDSNWIEDNL